MRKVLSMAHRGIPWTYPENSIVSFEAALHHDADIIEFDVRLSKDHEIIIMHDDSLDRTTNGTGLLSDYTYRELQEFEITFTKSGEPCQGAPIPKLSELIELIGNFPKVLMNCELKDTSTEYIKRVVDTFKQEEFLERTVFTSFHYDVLKIIKKYESSAKVQGFPLSLMHNVDYTVKNPELLFDYVGIKKSLASPAMLNDYKERGIIPGIWVLNNDEEYSWAIEMGAAIITTDRMDKLKAFLDKEV